MESSKVEYVDIDKSGRIVIPKAIRERIKGRKTVEIYYDEHHEDIHLKPVKTLKEMFGAFKGIKKSYEKDHEEDWLEHSDR